MHGCLLQFPEYGQNVAKNAISKKSQDEFEDPKQSLCQVKQKKVNKIINIFFAEVQNHLCCLENDIPEADVPWI